ncbi:Permease of the drug/metabolite transporter (DMT) superfamily [Peptostreptococcaceae bacterium pGA-8]|nr:Permease of the drug/metabolite transporter (DMT) superfamily [Peptostreptococcaceae bacterium pGA-8]
MLNNFKDKKSFLYVLILICALFWGFSFLATTLALDYGLEPMQLLMLRWSVAAILFVMLAAFRIIKLNYKGKNLKLLFLVGSLQPCIYSIFETTGIGMTSTSESSILIATIPLVVLILGILFFHKPAKPITIFSIILAFMGVLCCIVFSPGFSLGGKSIGYIVVMTAVVVGSIYAHYSSRAGEEFSPIELTFGMAIMAAIFFNIINFAMGYGFDTVKIAVTNMDIFIAVLFLGVGCSCICYIIFNLALAKLPTARASNLVANSTTSIGVLSGVIFASDPFGWYTVVGLIMTVTGVWLSTKE